jgi:hypothetical protein
MAVAPQCLATATTSRLLYASTPAATFLDSAPAPNHIAQANTARRVPRQPGSTGARAVAWAGRQTVTGDQVHGPVTK